MMKYQKEHAKTKKEYIEYYQSINKLSDNPTSEEMLAVFTEDNKSELARIYKLFNTSQANYKMAVKSLKQWNKFDRIIEDVVYEFNKKENLTGEDRLDPNLVKAVMFSETEMGTGDAYKKLVKRLPHSEPKATYQLNLGRVTNQSLYDETVLKFSIQVDPSENYKYFGNDNDVRLAAGALIIKYKYAKQLINKNDKFKKDEPWYNAVLAFKGVSEDGIENTNKVWKLYKTGMHPNTENIRLFTP